MTTVLEVPTMGEAAGPPAGRGEPPPGTAYLPRLKAIRQRRYMTQLELAAMSGVSHFTIRRTEQGHPVRYATLRRLATALGVEPGALTGETGP
jgi:DNA-binding XRE family transcriptional regulator